MVCYNGAMQHRLMILGSMDEFVSLVDYARSQGIYTIVCDGYEDGPAKPHADASFNIDVRDTDAIAQLCREQKVDGIIASFSDLLAECLIDIADRADLPCYAKPENFRYLREKPLMKEMFAELGINSAQAVKVFRDSIVEDIAPIGYPCVVKPANGYGSHGIYIIRNEAELREKYDEVASYSTLGYALAERLYTGHEFNMMNWMVDGEVVTLSIADRETSSDDPMVIPYVSRCAYPSRLIDIVEEEARAIVKKVADYVGISNGPLSMQFFWSEEDGIQVCECAGRLFGYEHELVTHACGLSIEELLVDYVYDHEALCKLLDGHTPHHPRHSCGLYLHGKGGTVANVDTVLEAMEYPHVAETALYYQPGEEITGVKPYTVRFYLQADTREEIDETAERIFSNVKVFDADGNNLLRPDKLAVY